jgi:hypothetical protein
MHVLLILNTPPLFGLGADPIDGLMKHFNSIDVEATDELFDTEPGKFGDLVRAQSAKELGFT